MPHFQSDTHETWPECLPWMSFKMGHVGSKTRSLGQILENPYVCSRGHIFGPILFKLGQNLCHNEVSRKGLKWINRSEKQGNYVKS